MRTQLIALLAVSNAFLAFNQVEKTKPLEEVVIKSNRTINGIGRMKDDSDLIIYAGKKNEIVMVDSLDANKAINNTRQIIGRIPGLNIIETESSGFTANGIGFRGLNPYQSVETNTRQNGYNISADIFGYNEAYYLPPMEAVKNITFLRGASSLAFGPQMGGMINYDLKDGGTKPVEVTTSQTIGSNNLFNSFNSIGGKKGKLSYYGFLQYRFYEGWRTNSKQNQLSGYASLKYNISPRFQVGVEYTGMRNTIQMPGGLTDSMFNENARQSTRTRNWLQSPWNILAGNVSYKFNENTSLSLKSTYLFSQRDLVWRNEDGGPAEKDSITPDLTYVPREVEHEYFKSTTNELRFLTKYNLGKQKQTLAMGIRYAYSDLKRQHGAEGTTGSDVDYTLTSAWGGEMSFYTTNVALFAENTFRFGTKFSVTPGVRLEYLKTIANGYDENEAEDSNDPFVYANNEKKSRTFLLAGIGLQYKLTENSNFYANYSQSYRPVTYSDLTPFGTIAKIDPNLGDASGDNVDLGFRGTFKNILNFDVSAFYLNYKNKIGIVYGTDSLTPALRTNTGTSEHKGIETYIEWNILNGKNRRFGKLSIYNSYAFIDAKYASGEFKGNQVEYAPKHIERVGLNYKLYDLSINIQYSFTSSSFGDASNATFSADALSGTIPSYRLVDISGTYRFHSKYQLKFGVNNLFNTNYFTLRTTEYPGPGIIPSIGRMLYLGFSANF